jgi:hypothetical protein
MRRGALLVALLAACSDPQSAGKDASAEDAGIADARTDAGMVDGGEGDAFGHCPPASAYVGDGAWPGTLETGGALFCAYPRRDELAADAIARKLRLKLTEGSHPFPHDADGAAFRIPACIERREPTPPEILEGTVSAELRFGVEDNVERRYVDASFPLSNGGSATLHLRAEPDETTVSLAGSISDFMRASMTLCLDGGCDFAATRLLLPCRLESNTCDELTFDGGEIRIDQFHWAGQVGSGFAAALRLRGELDGVPFDIDDYDRMTVTYGHHAFTRGLTAFFDEPIGDACGLEIEEIAEFSQSDVHLLDCSGARIGVRNVSAQEHRWREPCP